MLSLVAVLSLDGVVPSPTNASGTEGSPADASRNEAIVAAGRSTLTIVWHLLNDPERRFVDLGPGYYESRINRNRSTRNHVRELQALGYKVTLEGGVSLPSAGDPRARRQAPPRCRVTRSGTRGVSSRGSRLTVSCLPGHPCRAPEEWEGMTMRIFVAARWIGFVGVMAVLSGCASGSAPADLDPRTGAHPPAVSSPAAGSLSSKDLIATGPVLAAKALPFAEPSGAALPAPQQRALQQALDETVRVSSLVPGVTAAVLSPVGAWTGAAGVDGAGTALVPDAMTDIGSVTKTFTAAEVLVLAGQHRVDLDAPASSYLAHPLLARRPTVRQLLSHTSGIPEFVTAALFDAVDADLTRSWTAEQALKYVTDPLKPPGAPVMSYSNSNYLLLGLLIERVTGLSYAAAVRRDLLPGLGGRIAVQDAETPVAPLAAPNLTGTTTKFGGQFLPNRAEASVAGAAGGIAADASTLARWGYLLYGGHILDTAATVDMGTPVAPRYGLGTEILEERWGSSGGLIGHHGVISGYATVLMVNPERQLAIAVLVPGDPGGTLDTLAKRLLAVMRG